MKPKDVGRGLFALFLMFSSAGFVVRVLYELHAPDWLVSIAVIIVCAGALWVIDDRIIR